MKRNVTKIFVTIAVLASAITFSSCSTGRSAGNYPSSVTYDKSYNYSNARGATIKPVSPKKTSAFNNFNTEKKSRTYLGNKPNARKSSNYYDEGTIRNKTLGQEKH